VRPASSSASQSSILRGDDAGGLPQIPLGLPVDGGRDDLARVPRGHAQQPALRLDDRRRRGLAQPILRALQGGDMAGELVQPAHPRERRDRCPVGRGVQHRLARFAQQVGGVLILDQREIRRDLGFQREAAQQRLAKGVDGADAHPARLVQHMREQRPRPCDRGGIGRDIQPPQIRGQRGIAGDHPVAQAALQAQRHLRRRRLGKGQALDALRRRTGQQQAQHAVGQQLGLARPGRGGDER
jgi:hypothetical protein